MNIVWLHSPAMNPRATNTAITGPVRSPSPADATSFAAYSTFSTTWNPRPAIAPYTNPSTTLLICERASNATATTPSSFNGSSTVGPASAGPHRAANPGDHTLATRSSSAMLPGIAADVATSPPQANAVASSSGGSRSR